MGLGRNVTRLIQFLAAAGLLRLVLAKLVRKRKDKELFAKRVQGEHVVVLTGAASGVGFETALLFLSKGWRVFALDVNEAGLDKLKAQHPEIETVVVDLADRASCVQACKVVEEATANSPDGVDCLVNCAGITFRSPAMGTRLDLLEKQVKVNLLGPVNMCHLLLGPLLKGKRGGTIINISSISGTVSWPFQGIYGATKFGLNAFSDAFRRENLAFDMNLRVAVIQPGAIWTDLVRQQLENGQQWFEKNQDSLVYSAYKRFSDRKQSVELDESSLGSVMLLPEDIARSIYITAMDPSPPPYRLVCAPVLHLIFLIVQWLPTSLADKVMIKF